MILTLTPQVCKSWYPARNVPNDKWASCIDYLAIKNFLALPTAPTLNLHSTGVPIEILQHPAQNVPTISEPRFSLCCIDCLVIGCFLALQATPTLTKVIVHLGRSTSCTYLTEHHTGKLKIQCSPAPNMPLSTYPQSDHRRSKKRFKGMSLCSIFIQAT